jgi:anti-sigma factor RsiW
MSDAMLDAYLDGELDDRNRSAIEAFIETEPAAADYVRRGRRLRHDLHRLFDGRFHETLPPHHAALGAELDRRMHRDDHRGLRQFVAAPLQIAIGASLVIALAAAVGVLFPLGSDPSVQDRLFALFGDTRAGPDTKSPPGQEIATPGLWLAEAAAVFDRSNEASGEDGDGALDAQGSAPDLSSFGFRLVGARLLAGQGGNSMQLLYEASEGMRVELFYGPDRSSGRTSLVLMDEGPVAVLFWYDGDRSYSLIGEVDRDTLLEMGRVVSGDWTARLPGGDGQPASEIPTGSEAEDPSLEGTLPSEPDELPGADDNTET